MEHNETFAFNVIAVKNVISILLAKRTSLEIRRNSCLDFKSNQSFHYTRCDTSKRVMSLRALSLRRYADGKGNTVSDLTDPRFEAQAFGSRFKFVTVDLMYRLTDLKFFKYSF